MRTSLLFLALAVANGATPALSSVLRGTKYTSTSYSVSGYLNQLTPVAKDVLIITVLPEEGRPDYDIYWVRDAPLAYHAWFIGELVLSPKDEQIRALLDDYVQLSLGLSMSLALLEILSPVA